MRKILWAVVIVGLALPLHAYIVNQKRLGNGVANVKWASMPVTWRMNTTAGSNITGSRTISAVADTSFASWTGITTATITVARGANITDNTEQDKYGYDQINLVKTNQMQSQYDATGAGSALAITGITTSLTTGDILDADIIFNPSITFSTDASLSSSSTSYDFESVLTHEVGHFFGLDHSAILSATMFPRVRAGNSAPRVLSDDDKAGVSALYPSSTYSSRGSISGTVRLPSGTVYGAIVVAVDSNGKPAAHGVSDNRGNYTIYGLPAGTYQVYAEPMDAPYEFSDQGVLGNIFSGSTISTAFTTRFR